jgi:hypothetical protein
MYMGGRDDTLASCPILFWHGITWLILVSIFAISAWAASLYVMPLVEKAHRIADEGYALITKANTKFELVDEIEEQVKELDDIIPTIKSTVVKMNEKLDEFALTVARNHVLLELLLRLHATHLAAMGKKQGGWQAVRVLSGVPSDRVACDNLVWLY